ncbi:hypothetical protein C8R45DRAFT_935577 [Mycena sanguinolenta]|nr:hypothetical protein C8R45DRAFT_935577 [Mycena sanguinolenta]
MSNTTVKIPEEWDRNAPHFDSNKPEELQQFLDHMESLMEKAKTPRDEKKGKLVRYADYTSKREWMSLPSFQDGSYEDFIKEILSHYPSVRDSERGSISQLNKLLSQFSAKGIGMDDQDELMDLIRPLQLQVKRLIPGKLTNKTAIARFMEKLAPEFVSRIWMRLEMDEVARNMIPVDPADADAVRERSERLRARETERYLFDEVIAVAREIAKGSNDRGEYDFGASTSGTERINRRPIKSEMDVFALNMEKKQEAHMDEMKQWSARVMDRIEQFMKVNSSGNSFRQGEGSSHPPAMNRPMTLAEIICHYCRLPGHVVNNCEHRQRHIAEGLLKVSQGKDYLGDGTPAYPPRDGRSKRDFVEDYYKKKSSQNYIGSVAGVYNVSTDMEDALFPNGTDYDPRDDEILSLRVAEANLKRQLTQVGQVGQGERTIQLVQQQQPVGVVQPTPSVPTLTPELAQAISLLSSVAQSMQQTQQQLVAQTRAEGSRKGVKGQGKQKPLSAKSPEDQAKQKKPEVDKTEAPSWRKPRDHKKVRFEEEESGVEQRRELPFRDVPPVEFSDRTKGVASSIKPETVAEIASDVAYRLRAPIDEIKDASVRAIVETIKSVTVGIPLKDLIAAAPAVQRETKNLVTKKRVPVKDKEGVHLRRNIEEIQLSEDEGEPLPGDIYSPEEQVRLLLVIQYYNI